jgi:hypothetical protein
MTTNPEAFAAFQDEAFRTVGAIWLDDGTLAGWQLTMDVSAEDDYCATQLGRYLSDEDEIIDHE